MGVFGIMVALYAGVSMTIQIVFLRVFLTVLICGSGGMSMS